MNKKLEARIYRLEKMLNATNKFEDVSSDQFISSAELFYIVSSLSGLSGANSALDSEKEILEKVANKYNGKAIKLNLRIKAPNFDGDLSDLLSDIFDYVEEINRAAEKAVEYNSSIRDKYSL